MSLIENLSAITTPALTDLLYVYQNGVDYNLTNAQLLALMKENIIIPLTQAQYDALPSADKNNGSLYVITDASITTADISDFSTFIHDLSFPSVIDGLAEIPVNITSGADAGQKKVLVNQLTSVIQASTNLDDLNDVVTASVADGDVIAWDATGGMSGNGGWMNKNLVSTGSITAAAGATIRNSEVKKRGNIIVVSFAINTTSAFSSRTTLGNISTGFRPNATQTFVVGASTGINYFVDRATTLLISATGDIIAGDLCLPSGNIKEVLASVTYTI